MPMIDTGELEPVLLKVQQARSLWDAAWNATQTGGDRTPLTDAQYTQRMHMLEQARTGYYRATSELATRLQTLIKQAKRKHRPLDGT